VAAGTATARRPYSPSWIDRLTGWIAGLPIPEGVVYIAIALAAFGLLTAAQWFGGAYPVGQVKPTHAAVAAAIGAYLWLARRFNVAAGAAVRGLGPMLTVDAARASDLEYRLTTLPAAPTLILGLAVSALTLVRIALYPESMTRIDLALDPISLVLTTPVLVGFAFVGSAVPLKAASQGWLIYRITTRHVVVHLFEVGPLYAFSTLTSWMTISLIATGVTFFVVQPALTSDPVGLASLLIGLVVSVLVFVLPLSGVHGRLVEEKVRLRGEINHHMEKATNDLHRAVNEGDLASMDPLNKAIASLEIEERRIERAPTWPWEPETLRWVVGALMFPVVLFLLQLLIQRLVA